MVAGGKGTRHIAHRSPVTLGLTSTSKHEGLVENLIPLEGSNVARRKKVGFL